MDRDPHWIETGVAVTDSGRVGTDLEAIIAACKLAIAGDASRAVSLDAEVVLEMARRLRDPESMSGSDPDLAMKDEYDFSGCARGKFFRPDATVKLPITNDTSPENLDADADQIRSFVSTRLESMASRPRSWAGTREVFIVQLALLIEVSWIGCTKRDDNWQGMLVIMSDLCGSESGCVVPTDLLTLEWARDRVDIARKYVFQ